MAIVFIQNNLFVFVIYIISNVISYELVTLNKPWWDANIYCQSLYGSQLLTIQNESIEMQLHAVSNTLNQSIWIGYNNIYDSTQWKWIDKTNSKYTHWATNNSNQHNDDRKCAVLSYNGWYSKPCSNLNYFICGDSDNDKTKLTDFGNITFRINSTDTINLQGIVNNLNQSVLYCHTNLLHTNIGDTHTTIDLNIKCNLPQIQDESLYILQDDIEDNNKLLDTNQWIIEWVVIISVIFAIILCCICGYSSSRLCRGKTLDNEMRNKYDGYDGYESKPEPNTIKQLSNCSDPDMLIAEKKPLPNQLKHIEEDIEQNIEEDVEDIELTDSRDHSKEAMWDQNLGHQRIATNSINFNGEQLHTN